MKITNFRDYKEQREKRTNSAFTDLYTIAKVDVTTGWFWFKTTETREVFAINRGYWRFVDTGEYCPGYRVENLHNLYSLKKVFTSIA